MSKTEQKDDKDETTKKKHRSIETVRLTTKIHTKEPKTTVKMDRSYVLKLPFEILFTTL